MDETPQGDTSVATALFRHNTWANLTLLDFCAGLTAAQLDATAVGGFGAIRETLVHIASSEVDYVNLVTERWPDSPPPPDKFLGFAILRAGVRWAGEQFIRLASTARADTIVRVTRPDEPIFEYPLASFLVQVVNHSTAHREQISTIITQLGLEPPSISGWGYMRAMGEFREFDAMGRDGGE
ncbi:MAG TPA: DinB family protein, partial [Thermomicrobiales bacterium]